MKQPPVAPEERDELRLSLRSAHPLIRSTAEAFKDKYYGNGEFRRLNGDQFGRLQIFGDAVLKIFVSPALESRALATMDLLLKTLENTGWTVKIDDKRGNSGRRKTLALLGDEHFEIGLFEKTSNVVRVRDLSLPSASENACTGVLEFVHLDTSTSFRVVESATQRLDTLVPKFVEKLSHAAELRAERNAERDIQHRQYEKELQLRAAKEKAKQDEIERRLLLQADAAKWQQAELVRHYISAVESNAALNGSDISEWTRWARQVAAELDPVFAKTNFAYTKNASAKESGHEEGAE